MLTCRLIRFVAVAAGVAVMTLTTSGCGTRQDGSGAFPVLSFPRPGAAPRQTEPELPITNRRAEIESAESDATDSLDAPESDPFSGDVQFEP
jgi:hypothetical protein